MRIIRSSAHHKYSQKIMAAEGDVFDDEMGFDEMSDEDDAIADQIDNIQDNLEDVQDAVEDIQEEDVDIDIDNNIVNHLIAECENCKKTFISAMIESDQEVESISGICPCCGKDTVQQLKWVIKKYPEDNVL